MLRFFSPLLHKYLQEAMLLVNIDRRPSGSMCWTGGNGFVWYDCIDDCRCKYGRIIDRTLIQTALASLANLDVTKIELRVNIAPQSSAHRTRAIAALCDELNRTNTIHSCRLWRGIGTNMISLLRY